jgi:D-alanyl-D-alanine endopeptidase (penicillin-binding protein 7)
MVMDQASGEVLLEKNADAALPIASITKVMTAMVVLDAAQPLDEMIVIAREDTQLEKYSASRLKVGASSISRSCRRKIALRMLSVEATRGGCLRS